MKINKNELLKALTFVRPAVATKELIEQSTYFVFKDNKVISYNDEMSIQSPVNLPIIGAIAASELFTYVNKINTEEINVEQEDTQIVFKAGRSKAGFTLIKEIMLPLEEINVKKKWVHLPENFNTALQFTAGACSTNMSTPVLTCVHVTSTKMEGSDNYRIANYTLSEEMQVVDFLLPAHIAIKVARMSPIKIAITKGWVHFKTKDSCVISCRVFEDKFPDTSVFFEMQGKDITLPENLIDVIERAGVFSKREHMLDETISLILKKGALIVRSESETGGWYEEKMRVTYKGEQIEFKITPYLLKDILSRTNKAILATDRMFFSDTDWKYLSMLKRQ